MLNKRAVNMIRKQPKTFQVSFLFLEISGSYFCEILMKFAVSYIR